MVDQTDDAAEPTTEAVEGQTDSETPAVDAPDEGQEASATDRQSRRSAHWRERATSAEARADRLTRREVLRLLGEQVTDAEAALTLEGGDLADLLGEDGDVDAEAVAELASRVTETRPYLRIAGHHSDLGPKASLPRGRAATRGSVIRGR